MPVATATAALSPDLMLRLRELALHDARQALAAALAGQSAAEAALAQAMQALALRQAQAMQSDSDEAVDAFASWLPEGRRVLDAAGLQAAAAAAATAGARAALSLALAAALAETRTPPPGSSAPGSDEPSREG